MEENVKAKTATRIKEKRPPLNQDGVPKKLSKNQGIMKNDLPQVSPSSDGNASIKKLLNEANKIMKIGMEKEYALLERETTLQNSNETIDNLRKNMLHLQMEYEKLDQNFQREVSYRTEIVKRMDATRELVESVVQCSNVLSASLKQLEDDKLKIAEFYELIYEKQKEAEAKHVETEKSIKAQDELLKSKMLEISKFQCKILSQNSDTIAQLNKKLNQANDRLKITTNENENLQQKIQDLQESSNRQQMFLEQQEKLNSLHRENAVQFKQNLKKLKIHRFKYQKLLKRKKQQLSAVIGKNKSLIRTLRKRELVNGEILESKENEWRNEFEKHLEEDGEERQTWEAQKLELLDKLTDKQAEIDSLKEESQHFSSRILELEGAKRKELEEMQNDLSRMLSENLKLREDVAKMSEENSDKAKMISKLEMKSKGLDADFNSQLEFYKRECEGLKDAAKRLESQLSGVQKELSSEKAENEKTVSVLKRKLEDSLRMSDKKINELENVLEEKMAYIEKLESEQNETVENGKTTLEKLNNEMRSEKAKNKELNNALENIRQSYDRVNKQLEEAEKRTSNLEGKLADLTSQNETLDRKCGELEENADSLKKELELEKKLLEASEEKHKKTEKELSKMEKLSEENSSLKASTAKLKNLLEAMEVRLETYKATVKKLENDKIDAKNSHSEEVSKLKLELESLKKERFRLGTPQKITENTQQNKREPETPITRTREKPSSSRLLNAKENEPEMGDIDKWQQVSASPSQSGKKFLSTPRKMLTSTPQHSFRSVTPIQIQNKRDPYEFDSDSSVERFDQDQVLKVFNRKKRDPTKKRSKTAK